MKKFVTTDPSNHQSENIWFTPRYLIDVLGPFDLDPCTVSYRPFDVAKYHIEYDKGGNGLEIDWFGDVFLNPPYGQEIAPFVKKFTEYKKGILLVFSRTGSQFFQDIIKTNPKIFFMRQRIKFISKDGSNKTNAGTDSSLIFYDEKYIDRVKNINGVLI